jgi:hypothetical protein
MNNPHHGELPFSGSRFQTVFFTEGNQAAILVTEMNGTMQQEPLEITTAEAALAWAKANQAGMVYNPFNASGN